MTPCGKIQILVYHTLPPTTATVDYVIGLEKLSVNGQFFDDAQMAASVNRQLKLCQIYFMTVNVAYLSTNKTKLV